MAACEDCGATLDSSSTCPICGIVWENSALVSDLTFGESANGAAIVTGSFVSSDRSGPDRGGLYGHGSGGSAQEITIDKAKSRIYAVGHYLKVTEPIIQAAILNFKYALALNFVRGRKAKYVTCACIYLGCRLQNTPHMIMEFASFLKINVFTLGKTYTKLVQTLRPMLTDDQVKRIALIDPSVYIQRFLNKLNLTAEDSKKVHDDAQRLAKRMKTDWMTDGRRPAGVAAAAVLIACRMNNLQRSKAQIMQISMVAESTIDERLLEFKNSDASSLTVDDFRATNVSRTMDPPSFLRNRAQERVEHAKKHMLATIAKSSASKDEDEYSDEDISLLAEKARLYYNTDEITELDDMIGDATAAAVEAAKLEKERDMERQKEKEKLREERRRRGEDDDDEDEDEDFESAKEEDDDEREIIDETKEEEEDEMEVIDETKEEYEEMEIIDETKEEEEYDDDLEFFSGTKEKIEEEGEENDDDFHEGEEVVGIVGEEVVGPIDEDTLLAAFKGGETEENPKKEEDEDEPHGVGLKEEDEDEENDESGDDDIETANAELGLISSAEAAIEFHNLANSENGKGLSASEKSHIVPALSVPSKRMKLSREERINLILKRHNHPMLKTSAVTKATSTALTITSSSATDVNTNDDNAESDSADPASLSDLDDAEIEEFLCTPKEAEIRKRLWMSVHHDYEIKMAHKRNKIEADKRAGTYKEPRKRKSRHESKYGFKSEGESNGIGGGSNASEVARNMVMSKSKLLKVPKKSKKINYGVYDDMLKLPQD